MNICFICPEYPIGPHGGIGTYTQRTARALSNLGHNIRVIGVYSKNYPAPDYEEEGNIKIWRLRVMKGKFGWLLPWIKQYRIIIDWIKHHEIDILEAPDSRGWFAFWKKLPVPIVLRFHGSQGYIAYILGKNANTLTRILENLSYRRADALCSVSKFNALTTSKIFDLTKPIRIIYNGVELINITNRKTEDFTIVFANTLSEYKGILDFLHALVLLMNTLPKFNVHIYGKDTRIGKKLASEYISSYSKMPRLIGKVNYHGNVHISELFVAFQQASVAVFPSYVESFGFGPVESMMCECPTIFTDNTTGNEIIDDKIDGLLISPHQPNEIKDAILFLHENPSQAEEIGRRGRMKVYSKFSLTSQIKQNLEFYHSCIETHKMKYRKKSSK